MSGMRRASAGADPFLLLMEDHRKILATLDKMMAVLTSAKLRRTRLFLMLKRKLAKHALAEDVVYPILHGQEGEWDESKHLYDEHADVKIWLYELDQRLKSGLEWTSIVKPLRDLIRRNVEEEEQKVFPELRRSLDAARLPKISSEISREEAMIL